VSPVHDLQSPYATALPRPGMVYEGAGGKPLRDVRVAGAFGSFASFGRWPDPRIGQQSREVWPSTASETPRSERSSRLGVVRQAAAPLGLAPCFAGCGRGCARPDRAALLREKPRRRTRAASERGRWRADRGRQTQVLVEIADPGGPPVTR